MSSRQGDQKGTATSPFPLPAPLQRAVCAWLGAVDVERMQSTCRALRAALAHDALWRALFDRDWGPAPSRDNDNGPAESSWQRRFAERAAQRRRALQHEPVRACTLQPHDRQFYLALVDETLFVSNEAGEVLVRTLPELALLATWVPHQVRHPCYTYLWVCGQGAQTRLATFSSESKGPIRLWCPRAVAKPAPRCELELVWPLSDEDDRDPAGQASEGEGAWPLAVFSDDVRQTVLALCNGGSVLEWSRETGLCLRQLRFAHVLPCSPVVQFDGQHLLVHSTTGGDLHALDMDRPAAQLVTTRLRDLLEHPRVWRCNLWRRVLDLWDRSIYSYGPRGVQSTDVQPFVLSDLLRPRRALIDEATLFAAEQRHLRLAGNQEPFDLACSARFLVLLTRSETLLAFDYGADPPAELRYDPALWRPVAAPKSTDWLAQHREADETYDDFRRSRYNRLVPKKSMLYLQPIGEFVASRSCSLDVLRDYATVFFGLQVRVLPTLQVKSTDEGIVLKQPDDPGWGVRYRHNQGVLQLLTTDVTDMLLSMRPKDAYLVLAVTMIDLYPRDSWNFVFGEGSRNGVGVFSFARYMPGFPESKEVLSETDHAVLLRRSCKVMVHEMFHIFGASHCNFFHCTMNGANNLEQFDSQPLAFCPVCLRKLQLVTRCRIAEREQALAQFYARHGPAFATDWTWTRGRLKQLGVADLSPTEAKDASQGTSKKTAGGESVVATSTTSSHSLDAISTPAPASTPASAPTDSEPRTAT